MVERDLRPAARRSPTALAARVGASLSYSVSRDSGLDEACIAARLRAMEESELVLEEVGIPRSDSTVDAALVSHDKGFDTILRTLPSNSMGEAATRRGEKAERVGWLDGGGASVLAATGVAVFRAGESVSV